jgi:hypothetical protein
MCATAKRLNLTHQRHPGFVEVLAIEHAALSLCLETRSSASWGRSASIDRWQVLSDLRMCQEAEFGQIYNSQFPDRCLLQSRFVALIEFGCRTANAENGVQETFRKSQLQVNIYQTAPSDSPMLPDSRLLTPNEQSATSKYNARASVTSSNRNVGQITGPAWTADEACPSNCSTLPVWSLARTWVEAWATNFWMTCVMPMRSYTLWTCPGRPMRRAKRREDTIRLRTLYGCGARLCGGYKAT